MTKNLNFIRACAQGALVIAIQVFAVGAYAGTTNATLAWNANTETNLAGYRIYYGTASGSYSASRLVGPAVTTATISNLTSGTTYYFAAKATNSAGLESPFSTEVVYVAPVAPNNAPVAIAQNLSTPEDVAKAITLSGADADGNTLSFSIVSSTSNGQLSGTLPNITYTPSANFNGTDSFVFKANDGTTDSAPATITITVTPVNDLPSALAQSVTTTEDVAKAITLAGTDLDGNALTYSIVASPAHGALSGTLPNITYTPTANYSGSDSFTFKVNDGTADSAAATVSITVSPVNDVPIASSQSVTTAEDTAKTITLAGSDVDGNTLTYAIVTSPTSGTLSGTAPNVTYTPAANFNGSDSFTFRVNDGTTNSAPATVFIAVTAVNDAPLAVAQSVVTDRNLAKTITLTGSDADNDALTFTVVVAPTKGVLSGTAPNLTYTPNNNVTGADSFTFRVSDGTTNSATATVAITINAGPNTAPVADAQNIAATEDTAKAITLTGSDLDGNTLSYAITTAPAHGTLTGTAPNLTYTPAANYNGADSFWFRVNDGTTNSAQAVVSIAIAAANDVPVATSQSVSTVEDIAKSITLTGTDLDGDTLAFSIVAGPSHGSLSGSLPNVIYTPATNYSGSDSFTFKANDGTADSPTATVSITVTPANDAPVASAQSVSTLEDTSKTITLAGTDVDANSLTYTVVTQPAHGALTGSAPNLTYKPATNYNGSDSFTFKANDGALDSAPATVFITVSPVNDSPAAITQSVATDKNVATSITLAGSDPDGDALTYSVVTSPSKGVLSGTAPNLIYTPNNNVTGADVFTFKVNDGSLDSTAVPVYVNVNAGPNTAPVAVAQDVATTEDTSKAITLVADDADGNAITYSVVTPPAHGSLSGTAPNLTYTPTPDYSGTDNFWFKANDGATDSVPAVVSIVIAPINDPPTLNAIANVTLNAGAGLQTVTLSGISAGSNESQPLTVTVGSSNPALIPTPAVNYASPSATGSISFTPNAGASGSAVISVTVDDGQIDNHSVTRSFTVSVNPSNVAPSITLTSPAGGDSFTLPATVHLGASASATGHTITKVQFYNGTNLLNEDTSAPYEYDWSVADAGDYTVSARLVYDGSSTVDSAPASVSVADLPGPWAASEIGLAKMPGDITVTGDVYTVSGAGVMTGTSDSCRFVYQPLNADGEIKVRVDAAGDTSKASRAGVMIRENTSAGSKYAFVGISGDGFFRWQTRTATSGKATLTSTRGGVPGVWLRLVRSGKSVSSFRSYDGINWARLNSANFSMATNICVGIVVASGNPTTVTESRFASPTVLP